jgi:hypothetical protein
MDEMIKKKAEAFDLIMAIEKLSKDINALRDKLQIIVNEISEMESNGSIKGTETI